MSHYIKRHAPTHVCSEVQQHVPRLFSRSHAKIQCVVNMPTTSHCMVQWYVLGVAMAAINSSTPTAIIVYIPLIYSSPHFSKRHG